MDIAVVVQRQILSTRAGVMFTIDPATGRGRTAWSSRASFGLGEAVVSGSVSPDRYVVEKETLAILAREVRRKELVIEPAAGGGTVTRELDRRRGAAAGARRRRGARGRRARPADRGPLRLAAGHRVGVRRRRRASGCCSRGRSRRRRHAAAETGGRRRASRWCAAWAPRPASRAARCGSIDELDRAARLSDGDVLVTHMTAPDWVPLMRRAAAIVTDSGGMTCHAAIVSRELGIPCVVGTAEATRGCATASRHGRREPRRRPRGRRAGRAGRSGPGAAAAAARRPWPRPRRSCSSTSPSRRRSSARRRCDVDGVGLLRAELMVIEALEGAHPRLLHRAGPRRRVRRSGWRTR